VRSLLPTRVGDTKTDRAVDRIKEEKSQVEDDRMSIRAKALLVVGVVGFGLASYGAGSGWLRFGPPGRDASAGLLPQLDRIPEWPGEAPLPGFRLPRFDGAVVQAQQSQTAAGSAAQPAVAAGGQSGTTAPASTPPAPVTPAAAITQILESASGTTSDTTPVYVTPVPTDLSSRIRLRSNVFWVKTNTPDPNAKLTIGTMTGQFDQKNSAVFFDLSSRAPPLLGMQRVILTSSTPLAGTPTQVNLIVPSPGNQLVPPVISQDSTGKFADPATISTDPNFETVYGSYLRVLGQDGPVDSSNLHFFLYLKQPDNTFLFQGEVDNPSTAVNLSTRSWDSTLTLPTVPVNTSLQLFAVSTSNGDHRFSSTYVPFQRASFTIDLSKPPQLIDIALPSNDPKSPNGTPIQPQTDVNGRVRFYANQTSLIFHGTGAKPGTTVLVTADGQPDPIAKASGAQVNTTTGEWWTKASDKTISDKILTENVSHTARASLSQGDQTTGPSDALTFFVSTKGPKLDSASASGPGPELGLQLVAVHFTGNSLNLAQANTKENYSLQPSDSSKSAITPGSAVYDDNTKTVTLQFSGLPADQYTLQIVGTGTPLVTKLTDLFGNPISDKTSVSVTVTPNGGDVVDQIPKPEKAPNAVFPEFNNPRPEANGFNPSDHVDTRVSRLYFFRDARRVAEIINRDLKSYNQAAVDTRRRLAEKARDKADTLTDQRRLQEIKAVHAAQGTRDVQRRLDAAQGSLQQNQASISSLQSQLQVLNDEQAELEQRREQFLSAAGGPAPAPSAAPPPATPGAPPNPPAPTPPPTSPSPEATAALNTVNFKLDAVQRQIDQTKSQLSQANGQLSGQNSAVQSAQADLQSARQREADASDQTVQDQAQEDRARENQFRLEVAAAHEDPNSYVPGKPDSVDPVLQVSISVIGEGVLQLRGPIKGINIIRRMINEMDDPTGQVRIALHTVQINGEHEERMEKVASRIQAYVDHARFLTVQSSQMLRNAVVKVASRKAEEACADLLPEKAEDPKYAATQELRDRKYQEAFFGIDFINELHDIDAEFLHSSNKLLSLNSMDTTSLASALFMLALAKNETRLEILEEFKSMLATDLPEAENTFELSSGRTGKEHHLKVLPLAQNAHFQSLMGFFNAEVAGNDTLNPLQREFIKLAQILKSRLVTELEYNQRFRERGLIEERLGNYLEELKAQKAREDNAKKLKAQARETVSLQRILMETYFSRISSLLASNKQIVDEFRKNISYTKDLTDWLIRDNFKEFSDKIREAAQKSGKNAPLPRPGGGEPINVATNQGLLEYLGYLKLTSIIRAPGAAKLELERLELIETYFQELDKVAFTFPVDGVLKHFIMKASDGVVFADTNSAKGTTANDVAKLQSNFYSWIDQANQLPLLVANFVPRQELRLVAAQAAAMLDQLRKDKTQPDPDPANKGKTIDKPLSRQIIFQYLKVNCLYLAVVDDFSAFLRHLQDNAANVTDRVSRDDTSLESLDRARLSWNALKARMDDNFDRGLREQAKPIVSLVEQAFETLSTAVARYKNAERAAQEARQPLDAKKLLDLLIDEIEDKYIELLEGIRAHTANIDGYVKAIATALDDDFNNQFYYPAFKEIRKSSTFWDVTLGQVETTNILTNNRMFAKVEPQATMEFDLPKRDILINEAMNGAKALIDSYGALVADPSFLALTKLQSGQPTSSPAQGFGSGGNTVRNVLPGLPRSNDEQLLSQAPAGRREFGAPLEALIPDPAVYKFETGTGFEIRPVLQPDGQSVVFHLDYMYTTNVREPVRADEKHLGRIKRHFIDTEVQLGNYELREVSRYTVALKASRTSRGVPLLEDIPGLGLLFRPLPSASSSLQQNVILGQATIFPTLFDLMGLRIAPAVADLDTLRLRNSEFSVRGRARDVMNRVFDYSTSSVDEFLRVPPSERRSDLYRAQETIPDVHPNGYHGPGLNMQNSQLQEGYDPTRANPPTRYTPDESRHVPPEWAAPSPSRDHDSGHATRTETTPTAGGRPSVATQPERSSLSLLPRPSSTAPIPPPNSMITQGVSPGAPASAGRRPVNPVPGASKPVAPTTAPATMSPVQGPSLEPRQPSPPVSTRSRETNRPLSDAATQRAVAGGTKIAAPKPKRRSIFSRLLDRDH
jgi:hypothetical protein